MDTWTHDYLDKWLLGEMATLRNECSEKVATRTYFFLYIWLPSSMAMDIWLFVQMATMDIRLLGHKAFWTYYAATKSRTECINSLLSYYVKLLFVIFSIKTVFWSDISYSLREF